MAYSKQGFKDRVRDADGNLLEPGTLLRAEHLEKMEDELIELSGKTIKTDKTLSFENGVLSVNTASKVEADNTLPITSAAVHTTVGNIEILLSTI